MKSNPFLRWLILGTLLTVPPSQAFALDRYDLLTLARSLESQRQSVDALQAYADYIDSHPAVAGKKSGSYNKNSQYYLRNLLIAFSGMLDLQRELGQSAATKETLSRLREIRKNNLFGSKNLYSLGKIYREHGDPNEALACLRQVVDDQKKYPRKTNNKVFVRSCSDLIDIHRSLGQDREVEGILSVAEMSLGEMEYDFKDRYRIGKLLLDNGKEGAGAAVLGAILNEVEREGVTEEEAVVRTLVKLLQIHSGEREKRAPFVATLDRLEKEGSLGPGNRYALGIACLNAGEEARGIALLERVKDHSPETTYARRALFVLGRRAASAGDLSEAIRHYADYVERYPEPRFFALKAYSRLIDCQWALLKDPDVMAAQARLLADVVNDIADFETQLNLARDLKDKGFAELAEATFDLGMLDARSRLQKADDEERLRILCTVQKYAYPQEKYQLVEDSASQALAILEDPEKGNLRTSERARFFKEQTYIWLAQTYRDTLRTEEAIRTLSNFLVEFEGSRDADLVRFTLAEIYEGKGDIPKANGLYQKIGAGVWKDRAEKNLKKQGHAL